MPESFNPYFKWLGIPAEEQPPNHYRLLGVPLYIDDADVIENAADRQMSHVRTFQSGKNAKLTQRILNEVSAAKICLLDAEKKAAYDQSLRASLDEAKKPAPIAKPSDAQKPAAKPKAATAAPRKEPPPAASPLPPSKKTPLVPIVVAVVVLLALIGAGGGVYVAMFSDDAVSEVGNGRVVRPAVRSGNAGTDAGGEGGGSKSSVVKSSGENAAADNAANGSSGVASGDPQRPADAESSTGEVTDAPRPPAIVPAGAPSSAEPTVASSKMRHVEFSAPDAMDGLELFPWGDGPFVAESINGIPAIRAASHYLYFRINDEVLFGLPNDTRQIVTFRVTVFDDTPGKFTLHYDGHQVIDSDAQEDGTWTRAIAVEMQGTGEWKTVEVPLRHPQLANRQHGGGDFRISCFGDYRIALRKAEIVYRERPIYTLDKPVDLLQTVDLQRHRVWGEWSFDGKSLTSPLLESPTRIQVPFNAPEEYVLTVDVERVEGDNMLAIGLPVQGGQTIVSLDAQAANGLVSCLQTVDNQDCHSARNITRRFLDFFSNGMPATITCTVRNSGVEVRKDGEPVIQYAGDLRRLDEGRVWDVPDRGAFILGAWNSVFRITRMDIAPLDEREKSRPRRRYEAADMKLVGLGRLHTYGLALWSTGSNAVVEHEVAESGDYVVRVSAFESHFGDESAELSILVDGAAIAQFDVTAVRDAPEVYEAHVPIEAGRHQISLLYRNDVRSDEGDRNLFVTYLEIEPAVAEEAAQPPAVVRKPVPAKEDRDAALDEIKTLFHDEYQSARRPQELLKLAEKLGELAGRLKAEPTERFVVISEAWRFGREAGDAEVALSALDELAGEYEIDAWDLRSKTLTAVLRNAPSAEARTAAAQWALKLTEQAVGADRFTEAEDFAKTALAATSRARDADARELRTRATEWFRKIRSLQERWQAMQSAIETLKTSADDPVANLSLGKYFCFAKGDWQRGLPHLAKSGDARFAAVATGEQQAPTDATAQLALGDGWWELADDAARDEKQGIIARACHWYRRALAAGLSGLERKRIEKRLEENDPSYQAIDPNLMGHWTFDNGSDISNSTSASSTTTRRLPV